MEFPRCLESPIGAVCPSVPLSSASGQYFGQPQPQGIPSPISTVAVVEMFGQKAMRHGPRVSIARGNNLASHEFL